MTTKQEIIEFIENKLQVVKIDKLGKFVINSEFASKELIQMIKDLKPRVEKLEWKESRFLLPQKSLDQYVAKDYEVTHYTDEADSWDALYVPDMKTLEIPRDGYIECMRGILKEAQKACQKHYEESILENLEDE